MRAPIALRSPVAPWRSISSAQAPVDLGPEQNRLFAPRHEADAAAEKRNHIVAEPEPEAEDVGPLEEKRARLGEEERKARQVRATRVHLRLREVRVDRKRRYQ